MLEQAREGLIIADHSKIGQVLPALIAALDYATQIITDTGVDENTVTELAAVGVKVNRV